MSYAEPTIIAKLAATATDAPADHSWQETGLWLHAKTGGDWVSLPIVESSDKRASAIKHGEAYVTLHPGFWKSLQASRPEIKAAGAAVAKAKTGAFDANLGELTGSPQSPDDRDENPFYKFDGDASKQTAGVYVPATYDGSEPYGLIVSITPSFGALPRADNKWIAECNRHKYIWIGPGDIGNNKSAVHRVWLAQQARAWALHHYRIDPARSVISGSSNGADAASATAVATPFGFNAAFLFAPPCAPALGQVSIPLEGPGIEQYNSVKPDPRTVNPLSTKGLSNIRKNWRFIYVCGDQDKFLPLCRSSVNQLKKAGVDCKLFEVPGMGHSGAPPSITEYFEYLESPREAAGGSAETVSSAAVATVVEVKKLLRAKNSAKARQVITQLWINHPDSRTNEDVLKLIEVMEKLP